MDGFSEKELAALLPWPTKDANKYTRGYVCLVAGSAAYPGAACLAASAASRMGAGYVRVACADKTAPVVQAWQPSLVATPWSAGLPHLEAKPGRPQAYVLGPGFDANDETCGKVACEVVTLATRGNVPLLIDGGALGALSTESGVRRIRRHAETGAGTVLTPHGGEAARLAAACGTGFCARTNSHSNENPSANRVTTPRLDPADSARALSDSLGAVIVLKGPDTHIASPDERICVVTEGTPALAKAGTGDVLAGMIGALLAQGLTPFEAAALGVTLHARAGVAAAAELTEISVTPEDVIGDIPAAIKSMQGK